MLLSVCVGDTAQVEPAHPLAKQGLHRMPEEEVGGAQLAASGGYVADLVDGAEPVAQYHDASDRLGALEGQEQEEFAGFARGCGDAVQERPRGPAIADLAAMRLIVVQEPVDRPRVRELAHREPAGFGAA